MIDYEKLSHHWIMKSLDEINMCHAMGKIYMPSNLYILCKNLRTTEGDPALIPENKIDYCRLYGIRVEIDNTFGSFYFKVFTGKLTHMIEFEK